MGLAAGAFTYSALNRALNPPQRLPNAGTAWRFSTFPRRIPEQLVLGIGSRPAVRSSIRSLVTIFVSESS